MPLKSSHKISCRCVQCTLQGIQVDKFPLVKAQVKCDEALDKLSILKNLIDSVMEELNSALHALESAHVKLSQAEKNLTSAWVVYSKAKDTVTEVTTTSASET